MLHRTVVLIGASCLLAFSGLSLADSEAILASRSGYRDVPARMVDVRLAQEPTEEESEEFDKWAEELDRRENTQAAIDTEMQEFKEPTEEESEEFDSWAAELERRESIKAAIKREMQEFKEQRKLMLNEQQIGDDDLDIVNETLHSVCKELTGLTLADNKITDRGVAALVPALEACEVLEEFRIDNNKVTGEGIKVLLPALQKCEMLRVIYANGNQIDDAGAMTFAEMLPGFKTLKFLNLENNYIGDAGATALAEVLSKCVTVNLHGIYLRENQFGAHAVKALQAIGLFGTSELTPTGDKSGSASKESIFLVDKSYVNVTHPGLAYRLSKELSNKDPEGIPALWGTSVRGLDQGDGWLKVGTRFLPMKFEETPVLTSARGLMAAPVHR